MNIAFAALTFVPGLALGSFLSVVAARVPERRSIVVPRSACRACGTQLAWYDNVPLVSWVLLRGRCRHCSAGISPLYPGLELATAALLAACVAVFGPTIEAAVAAFFSVTLVAVTATDLERRIIPNAIVLPAAVVVLAAQTILHPSAEWSVAAFGAATFLLVAALAYPGGMGMGDVKLALLLGAMLGRDVTVALMAGMLAALVPSAVLVAMHGARARKMAIPFGPFLALGGLVALFAGDRILDAYLEIIP